MLCTTILFFEFCGLVTCLPEVVIGPGWLSVMGIVFMRMTLLDWGVRGCGLVWACWVDIRIRPVRYSYSCLWSLPVFSVFYLAILKQLSISLLGLFLILPFVSIVFPLLREPCESHLGFLLRLNTSAIFRLLPEAWWLPSPPLAILPLRGRACPLCVFLRVLAEEVGVMSSRRTTTDRSGVCFRLFWSFWSVVFVWRQFRCSFLFLSKDGEVHSLISSRNVWIEVREFRVSSVLEFSLHCSFSVSILEAILYMVSFEPCVFHVSSRLSCVLVVSCTLSRQNTTPSSTWSRRRVHWFRILFRFDNIFICKLGRRHSFKRFYT